MSASCYLDHAATTPVRPEAVEAWIAAPAGNASSLHGTGRRARRAVEEARESLAESLGVDAGDVIFTAGGTMADNLAIRGIHTARRDIDPRRDTVVVSAIEHHAVLDSADALSDARVVRLPVDAVGRVLPDALSDLLAEQADRISVVSVMSANNEIGTAQPIDSLAEMCASAGVPMHVDAVQSVGWSGWSLRLAGVAVSVSGHKFGAPTGIGALVLPHSVPCSPVIFGGGQERKVHSGTINVAGAAAMAAALAAARASQLASGEPGVTVAQLREELTQAVKAAVPDVRIAGETLPPSVESAPVGQVARPEFDRVPGIVSVLFDGCEADALLMLLDAAGIECSTGSACTAGIPEPSHVLTAMGASPTQARSALRFSLGWTSTRADIEALRAALPDAVSRARRASARAQARRRGSAAAPRQRRHQFAPHPESAPVVPS